MLSETTSAALIGVKALPVSIEVDISRGLPSFDIVGLPDKAVRESRERVRSAIKNSGFDFPVKKITINMAPADIKKIGPHFDLAIACGILAASGKIVEDHLDDYLLAGELSLSGRIKVIKGALPLAEEANAVDKKGIVLPQKNYREGALVEGPEIIPVRNLCDVVDFFNQQEINCSPEAENEVITAQEYEVDFSEIKGQQEARRALEVAAAGSHNIMMIGPPGSGKTMMARRLRTILPPLKEKEALELTKIYSIMGLKEVQEGLIRDRPFRAPHHNVTRAGLIGGGRNPEPGEVSFAHRGTLFLDEMPEFKRDVLEMLRQPLEEGTVTLVRSEMTVTFPADFTLVAAMNPCPCGYYGDKRKECSCTVPRIKRYRSRISGPLLDRIDIHIHVPGLSVAEITDHSSGEASSTIRKRVLAARERQNQRYKNEKFNYNSELSGQKIKKFCQPETQGQHLLENAVEELGLSARAYDRILRLARTISDLEGDGAKKIKTSYLAEAVQYRSLDRGVQL